MFSCCFLFRLFVRMSVLSSQKPCPITFFRQNIKSVAPSTKPPLFGNSCQDITDNLSRAYVSEIGLQLFSGNFQNRSPHPKHTKHNFKGSPRSRILTEFNFYINIINIYIYRDRERERERRHLICNQILSVFIHLYMNKMCGF